MCRSDGYGIFQGGASVYVHTRTHTHIYVYMYILHICNSARLQFRACERLSLACDSHLCVGLYTILLLPILYCAWQKNGRSRGGRILPSSRAIVLQQCGRCRRVGRMKERLIRAQTTRSKEYLVEANLAYTRYSFTSRLLCTNQPSFHSPRPPALPTLVQSIA